MIKQQFFVFLLRWLASSFGMFLCISWFGTVNSPETFAAPWILYTVAGLLFSLVNSFVKPLIKTMALPLAILTMGISTVIINTLMVVVTIWLLPGVEMDLLGVALSSIILNVINALLNLLVR